METSLFLLPQRPQTKAGIAGVQTPNPAWRTGFCILTEAMGQHRSIYCACMCTMCICGGQRTNVESPLPPLVGSGDKSMTNLHGKCSQQSAAQFKCLCLTFSQGWRSPYQIYARVAMVVHGSVLALKTQKQRG